MRKMAKRALLAALAVAALAADSWVSVRLAARDQSRAASAPVSGETASDPLQSFRLQREQLRARMEAQLNEVIYSGDDETAAQARRQLSDMLAREEAEAAIEGVLRARGFADALASVSANAANVLVRRDEALTQRESAVILELVTRETGLTGGNVKIIPVK